MNTEIRGALFDLDGTLVRDDYLGEVVDRVGRRVAARVGIEPVPLIEHNRQAWADLWPEMGDDWMLGRLPVNAITEAVWRRALHNVGVDDEAAVTEAVDLQWQIEVDFHELFPESLAVLTTLRDAGIRNVLVTNGASRLQRTKLSATGIAELFDAIVISSEVGVLKPDPAIFQRGLDAVGVSAEHALHVGDNLGADVAGARRTGLLAVWVNRHEAVAIVPEGDEPQVELTDLRALVPLVLDEEGVVA